MQKVIITLKIAEGIIIIIIIIIILIIIIIVIVIIITLLGTTQHLRSSFSSY